MRRRESIEFSDIEVSDEFSQLVRLRPTRVEEMRLTLDVGAESAVRGLSYSFDVERAIEEYHEMFSAPVLEFFHRPTSTYFECRSAVKGFLTRTREGQLLVERVVAEETPWSEQLVRLDGLESTSEPVVSIREAKFRARVGRRDGRWEDEEDDSLEEWAAKQQPLEELVGIPVHGTIRYVIRLMDSERQEWLYVGKSQRILQRLSSHISKGGDFNEARRKDGMVVVDIEELREDVTESELYEEVCETYDIPTARICGGR